MLVFESAPGQVVVVGNAKDQPAIPLAIGDFGGASAHCLITGVAIRRGSNFQVLPTTDSLYIYSFSEREGNLRVSGLTYPTRCDAAGVAAGEAAGHEQALAYYERARLDVATGPTTLVIGASDTARYQGYLVAIEAELGEPESLIGQFVLNFILLPRPRRTS